MKPEIIVPNFGAQHRASWLAIIELTSVFPIIKSTQAQWTLVGGQMVVLHAAEHGREVPVDRETTDGDVVANVRVTPKAVAKLSDALLELGFEHTVGPQGQGHRFQRSQAVIDVLGPDNVGRRASLHIAANTLTVEAPGGTQALRRSEEIDVVVGSTRGTIMRPNLVGAIVAKAAAASELPQSKHLRDVALLLTLVADPIAFKTEIVPKEAKLLASLVSLNSLDSPAWLGIQNPELGVATYKVLSSRAPNVH